jgi:hypothetical protein
MLKLEGLGPALVWEEIDVKPTVVKGLVKLLYRYDLLRSLGKSLKMLQM